MPRLGARNSQVLLKYTLQIHQIIWSRKNDPNTLNLKEHDSVQRARLLHFQGQFLGVVRIFNLTSRLWGPYHQSFTSN